MIKKFKLFESIDNKFIRTDKVLNWEDLNSLVDRDDIEYMMENFNEWVRIEPNKKSYLFHVDRWSIEDGYLILFWDKYYNQKLDGIIIKEGSFPIKKTVGNPLTGILIEMPYLRLTEYNEKLPSRNLHIDIDPFGEENWDD